MLCNKASHSLYKIDALNTDPAKQSFSPLPHNIHPALTSVFKVCISITFMYFKVSYLYIINYSLFNFLM